MRLLRRAIWGGALLACALAGCGEPAPAGRTGRVERIALSGRDGMPSKRARPDVFRRLTVPDGLAPWSFEGGSYELAPGPESGVELRVNERGEKTLVIPGSFDTASIDQIAVTLRTRRTLFLHARLFRGEEVVLRSIGSVGAMNQSGPQIVRLDFATERAVAACDRLEIVVRSYDGVYALIGVDLISIPPAARMAQLHDGPELIAIAEDSRVGLGLSSRSPLVGRVHVPRDAVLAFSYGLPPAFSQDGRDVALQVAVGGVERLYPLAVGSHKDARWYDARIELSEYAGRELEVEFSLRSAEPEESFCALGEPSVYSRLEAPPTVFFITSDTHRFDHLGSSRRGVDVHTPVLDALADSGVTFEDCFSSTNVTQPSHISLLTGTSLRDTGVFANKIAISRAAPTLAERFREAGFRTFAVVSAGHLADQHSGLGQGFDRMRAPRGAACDGEVSVDQLVDWLPAAEGQPLFVWLHLFDAHSPYVPPTDLALRHYPLERDRNDPALPEPSFPRAPGLPASRDVEYPRAMYRAEISYLDRELGRLFAFERLREGVVLFTADHGEVLGRHGVWWGHAGLYPDTIHVPLILRWPGGPRGARETRPVHHLDVARTLLDLAGLEGTPFPGRSLVDPGRAPDEPRFAVASGRIDAAVTVGDMHLILALRAHERSAHADSERVELHALELYDLARDPHCDVDLADRERETAARLRALLVAWLLDASPRGWALSESSMDEETLRALAELGYALDSDDDGQAELFDPECDCENCLEFVR